jgi:two-component system sensor histidine kinase KdpD
VRAGRRFAAALHADWIVAYIETPQLQRLPAVARDAVMENLRLAESLGATTVTLGAPQMSAAILDYAREKNITKILLGRPTRTGWRRWLLGSVVDTVVREAADVDVYLLGGEKPEPGEAPVVARSRAYLGLPEADRVSAKPRWPGYAAAVAAPALCTGIGFLVSGPNELTNLVMLYLLGVMLVAVRAGRGPSLLASVLSVVAFDFFFVPPEFTLAVSDIRYLVTFAVMLLVGIVISNLAANLRTQARVAGYREKRAASLYTISRALAAAHREDEIVRAAAGNIGAEFGAQCVILFPNESGRIVYPKGESQSYSLHGADLGVAQWVFDHGRVAGHGTDTLPGADAVYFPIRGASGPIGVLALLPSSLRRVFLPEQQRLLETFLNQVALAIERVRLAQAAQNAQIRVETESLRNSLLAGISHDLRTPLSAIVGAASSLTEEPERLSSDARRELARTIYEEGQRMATLANNILDMARLDAGAVRLNRDWVPLEEIVGGVLTRLRARLEGRPVRIALPKDAPLVNLDAVLIEQVLMNLLENALKYTPAGTAIEISAEFAPAAVTVSVADEGPGIPRGLEERLFDKFFRASPERAQSGVGLGLTICRAIVEAHGGTIRAENRSPRGAAFRFTLPRDEAPPALEAEDAPQAGAP